MNSAGRPADLEFCQAVWQVNQMLPKSGASGSCWRIWRVRGSKSRSARTGRSLTWTAMKSWAGRSQAICATTPKTHAPLFHRRLRTRHENVRYPGEGPFKSPVGICARRLAKQMSSPFFRIHQSPPITMRWTAGWHWACLKPRSPCWKPTYGLSPGPRPFGESFFDAQWILSPPIPTALASTPISISATGGRNRLTADPGSTR